LRNRIVLWSVLGLAAAALGTPAASSAPPETAVFAGGCFWSEEKTFEGTPGVLTVESGYTGGQAKNPSYEQVEEGTTGHVESVQIQYDPSKISYEKLLDIYWHNVDPLDASGQFCDHGPQYHSAIFYRDEAQKKAAEASKAKLEADPRFHGKIATQIVPASAFYRAEEYHQDFAKKNPFRYGQYRMGCGRDRRLKAIWGEEAGGHP
jgi:peptide-methionine (S)-S-oxide reductase